MSSQDLWEFHLKRAVLLIKELYMKAQQQDIDPRAVSVAMELSAMSCTVNLLKAGKITPQEEEHLHWLAQKLFKEAQEAQKKEGGNAGVGR